MIGEAILVVASDSDAVSAARRSLAPERYEIRVAASAEDALDELGRFKPRLVLTGMQLPGMDGLALTRLIKRDERMRGARVVALVEASAGPGEEQRALHAGCDGCIALPVEPGALAARIRSLLDEGGTASATPTFRPHALPKAEMDALRQRFLEDASGRAQQLLSDLDGYFVPGDARKAVHQWVGTGGLLGFAAISRMAHELEGALAERPVDTARVRESLSALLVELSAAGESAGQKA